MPIDQVHADASMSVSNKLQTATTTTAIVDAAIDTLEKVGYIVEAIQTDATYDPGVSPATDSKILITDSTALHTNIGSPVGLADDDIIKYSGSVYEVYFDASLRGSGASAYDRTTAERYTYNATAWVESDTISDHLDLQSIGTNSHAQIDTHVADATLHFTEGSIDHSAITSIGTKSHATLDTEVGANTTHISSDGSDHSDVVTNSAHTAGDGSDHADVATNTTNIALKAPIASPEFTGVVGVGIAPTLSSLDVAASGNATCAMLDTAAVAAGIGGGIYFGGNYTGTTKTAWAHILGLKENATDADFSGRLAFFTRVTGFAPVERVSISSGGAVDIKTGDLTITTGGVNVKSYTTGTLPAASTNSGVNLHDSTLNKIVRSNGTTYDTM